MWEFITIFPWQFDKLTSKIPSSLPSFPFTPACAHRKKTNQESFNTFTSDVSSDISSEHHTLSSWWTDKFVLPTLTKLHDIVIELKLDENAWPGMRNSMFKCSNVYACWTFVSCRTWKPCMWEQTWPGRSELSLNDRTTQSQDPFLLTHSWLQIYFGGG